MITWHEFAAWLTLAWLVGAATGMRWGRAEARQDREP